MNWKNPLWNVQSVVAYGPAAIVELVNLALFFQSAITLAKQGAERCEPAGKQQG